LSEQERKDQDRNDYLIKQVEQLAKSFDHYKRDCTDMFRTINEQFSAGSKTFGIHETRIDALEEWKKAQNGKVDKMREDTDRRLDGMRNILIGILVFLATSSILLALNMILRSNGNGLGYY